MSFRELRNFTEMMRALGYPRLVSVDNFRKPHFALVADILYWMAIRYDPNAHIPDDIDTENERVNFVMKVAELFATKAGIKLKTRRLYAADGKAVKELLKISTLLYSALRSNSSTTSSAEAEDPSGAHDILNSKVTNLKGTRALGSEITEKGANLYDLLLQEKNLREARDKALTLLNSLSNNDDANAQVKKKLKEQVKVGNDNLLALEKQVKDLDSDTKSLERKIKKRRNDLERNKKRLKSLQTVRPAFMDEYEKLERELQRMYEVYLERFRNLDYMEHQLDEYSLMESKHLMAGQKEQQGRRRRFVDQERDLIYGEVGHDDDFNRPVERPSAAPGRREGRLSREDFDQGRMRAKGSIADGSDSESEPSGLSDSDSRSMSGSDSMSASSNLIDDDDDSADGFSGSDNDKGSFRSTESDDDF